MSAGIMPGLWPGLWLSGAPLAAQTIAMAQQPIQRDQGMSAFDLAGIEHRFGLLQRLDGDADVLVLVGEAVETGGVTRIDAGAKEPDHLVERTTGRQDALDRDQLPERFEIAFLADFASCDLL